MAGTPAQRFLAHLRRIVGLLEGGDREAAAAAAAELQNLIAVLPSEMPEDELAEARRLMERYATLGEKLQHETLALMTRLGAARRVAGYGHRPGRP
jgi:hypothetical protein